VAPDHLALGEDDAGLLEVADDVLHGVHLLPIDLGRICDMRMQGKRRGCAPVPTDDLLGSITARVWG
jgi:hypothetical protein